MTVPTSSTFRALDHLSGGVAAHPEEADELREQLQQLESQVAAVRALHQRGTQTWTRVASLYCVHCDHGLQSERSWPCSTIAALDGVQAQGEQQ